MKSNREKGNYWIFIAFFGSLVILLGILFNYIPFAIPSGFTTTAGIAFGWSKPAIMEVP